MGTILGGVAVLIPQLRSAAGWGLVLLLVAIFPVNLHMALNPHLFPGVSPVALWMRLPLQAFLIAWAYWATRSDSALPSTHEPRMPPSSAAPPQDFASHRRMNPLHHYIVTPLVLAYLVYAAVVLLREPSVGAAFHLAFALGVLTLTVSTRLMVLTVQDRVIRLEMRLRLQAVLPTELAGRLGELDHRHLVALRFASDAELPGLVQRVLAGELTSGKAIKTAIRNWQPDHLRA